MSTTENFRHFSMLMLVIERVATAQRIKWLTFHNAAGQVIGRITLNGGMVFAGVEIDGAPYSDDTFLREASPVSALLTDLLHRKQLTASDRTRLQNVPLLARRALCSITARGLRRVAAMCELGQCKITDPGDAKALYDDALLLRFSPVELLLAAGRVGSIRYTDTAARMYETPPDAVEERWLFEWQPSGEGGPWPVMTTRLAERTANFVAQFGLIGQSLSICATVTVQAADLKDPIVEIVSTDVHIYYVVITDRYMALLIYPISQLDRVLKSLEGLAFSSRERPTIELSAPTYPTGKPGLLPHVSASLAQKTLLTGMPVPARAKSLISERSHAAIEPYEPMVLGGQTSEADEWLSAVSGDADLRSPPPPLDPESIPPRPSQQQPSHAPPDSPPSLGDSSVRAAAPDPLSASPAVSAPAGTQPGAPGVALAVQAPTISAPSAQTLQSVPTEVDEPKSGPLVAIGLQRISPPDEPPQPATSHLEPPSTSAPETASASTGPGAPAPPDASLHALPVSAAQHPVAAVSSAPLLAPPLSDPSPPAVPVVVEAPPAVDPPLPPVSLPPAASPLAADPLHPVPASAASPPAGPIAAVLSTRVPLPPDLPMHPLLVVQDLSASFRGRAVLQHVSMSLGPTGVHPLSGAAGSGKTALLGILSGRHRAATGWSLSGVVQYDGALLGARGRPALLSPLPGLPIVRLRSFLLAELDPGLAESVPLPLLQEVLVRVGLPQLADKVDVTLPWQSLRFTSAQWFRLQLAKELIAAPPLLLVDELGSELGRSEVEEILSLLHDEAQSRCVLLAVQDAQWLPQMGPRLFHLEGGVLHGPSSVPSPAPPPPSEAHVLSAPPALPVAPPAAAALPASAVSWVEPAPASAPAPASPPSGVEPVLSLRGFGIALNGRPMLEHIDLDVAPTGLHLVISAEAAEKRLLVRALCGPRSQHVKLLGEALFRGEPLSDQVGPVTIQTDARLAMSSVQDFLLQGPLVAGVSRAARLASCLEQIEEAGFPALCDKLQEVLCDLDATERVVVEVIRLRQKSPALLVLDEPLDAAPKDIQERLVAWLVREAQVRALLIFVADPAPFVAAVPSLTLLWLLNGEIHRTAPRQPDPAPSALVDTALSAPMELHPGQDLASEPPTDPEQPQYTEVVSHEPTKSRSRGMGPRGFQWLQPGQLAGLPAPGAMNDVEYDLDLIRGAGVDVLVTLTFERPALAIMDKIGLKSLYCPMEDMSVPSCEAAAELCKNVSAYLAKNQAVAYHCKAGLGRTGTMLATQLIWEGADARSALDRVRSVEAGWVQSGAQEQFLQRFERWMNDHNESVGKPG